MNIGFSEKSRKQIVTLFTWLWLIGSLIASAYFSFWLFPEMQNARKNPKVQIYFQAKDPADDLTIYYPNLEIYRNEFQKYLTDQTFLYISACDVLPLSQRPLCERTGNWRRISMSELNCVNVATCRTPKTVLSDFKREELLNGVVPTGGAKISISDLPALSWSDPIGWGDLAKLPLFFVCLFLAVKLGRALGEFFFLPYSK